MDKINLGPEGNADRRHFWEMCASRPPHEGSFAQESPKKVALWADAMVKQWEERWIVEEEEEEVTDLASVPLLTGEEIGQITRANIGASHEVEVLIGIITRLTGFAPSRSQG